MRIVHPRFFSRLAPVTTSKAKFLLPLSAFVPIVAKHKTFKKDYIYTFTNITVKEFHLNCRWKQFLLLMIFAVEPRYLSSSESGFESRSSLKFSAL